MQHFNDSQLLIQDLRAAGVAYKDCSVLYDLEQRNVTLVEPKAITKKLGVVVGNLFLRANTSNTCLLVTCMFAI